MATDTFKTGEENVIDNNSRIAEEYNTPSAEQTATEKVVFFRFGVRGPANLRKRNEAYKVTAGKKIVT